MRILSMTATFGCLNQATLDFPENGLLLIQSPNGSGKSTWCAFLRTMLYGLDTRQRDRKGLPADKNRYRPWSGNPMEGCLICEHEGKRITICRTSENGIPMGTFSAVDTESGLPIPDITGESVGEYLTGVSRDIFDRSVFLQRDSLSITESEELERRITSLVSSGEETTSWSEADSRLRFWQRKRRHHKTGQIPDLSRESDSIRQKLSDVESLRLKAESLKSSIHIQEEETARLDRILDAQLREEENASRIRLENAQKEKLAAQERYDALSQEYKDSRSSDAMEDFEALHEELEDIQNDLHGRNSMVRILITVSVLITVVGIALTVLPGLDLVHFLPQLPILLILATIAAVWVLVFILLFLKRLFDYRDHKDLARIKNLISSQKQQQELLKESLEQARKVLQQSDQLVEELSNLQTVPRYSKKHSIEHDRLEDNRQALAHIQGQLSAAGDPVLLEAQLDNLETRLEQLQEDYDAIDIALEVLRHANEQLHSRFSPKLNTLAGNWFSSLTDGRYYSVFLDPHLEVTVREDGNLSNLPLSSLSRGTQDQLYLSLRLAIAESLLPKPDSCPLILDDVLTTFDDDRLRICLQALSQLAKNRQIILMTCQHREAFILRNEDHVTIRTLP